MADIFESGCCLTFGLPIAILIVTSSLRIIYQYQRGVVFTLGRYSCVLEPGLRVVIPIIQRCAIVDMRLRVVDVPPQDAITKDNVSVKVNAVLYYKIFDAAASVIKVTNFFQATSQLAQTTMRNVVGEVELDELLSNRDEVSKRISKIVDAATDPWGIKVQAVELKHIELPDDMKRVMAKEAEAERLKRAIIIRSQGDAEAAARVREAARMLSEVEGALHLRTLQSLNDIASDPSNIVHFVVPLEVLEAYKRQGENKGAKARH
ncbi:MAG: SPFH domain-containing protein [Candidatus Micrarchaeota archaeon]|nr:SPFH domain-containing protein [Candidatus Micrarchaeota archaeon]